MNEMESLFKIFLVKWLKPFLMDCFNEFHNSREATEKGNQIEKRVLLLTTSEVCQILKCNRHFLYTLIREGKIVSANIGGGHLFRPDDIQKYIDEIFAKER